MGFLDKKKTESKGQEEMGEVGAALDADQNNQLDAFFEDINGGESNGPEEKAASEESEEAGGQEGPRFEEPAFEESEEEGGEDDSEESYGDPDDGTDESGETLFAGSDSEGEEETAPTIDHLAQIAEQKRLIAQLQAAQQQKQEPAEKPMIEIDGMSLISEEEADQLLTNPQKVLATLAERVYARAREDTLKDIPTLVESAAGRQTALQQARNKFFAENPGLQDSMKKIPAVGRLVSVTATDLQAEHPEWSIEQIFDETGVQVRKALNLGKTAQAREKEVTSGRSKRKNNQLSKPRGKRKSPPGKKQGDERSGLQKQIDDMAKSLS